MTVEEYDSLMPGDQVRIVASRVRGMNSDGLMDKWLGQVMTVDMRCTDNTLRMLEDKGDRPGGSRWVWRRGMIDRIADETEDPDEICTEDELASFIGIRLD